MSKPSSQAPQKEQIPERFQVSRGTLRVDSFMNRFIKIGGIGIICAVFGILAFILIQVLPLLQKARVEAMQVHHPDAGELEAPILLLGVDNWSERPYFLLEDGNFIFVDVPGGVRLRERPGFLPEGSIQASALSHSRHLLALADAGGEDLHLVRVDFTPRFDETGSRTITHRLVNEGRHRFSRSMEEFLSLDIDETEQEQVFGAIRRSGEEYLIEAVGYARRRSLMGGTQLRRVFAVDLTGQVEGQPDQIRVNASEGRILVSNHEGEVFFFSLRGGQVSLTQRFNPFPENESAPLASMEFLLGRVSLSFVSTRAQHKIFSVRLNQQTNVQEFIQIGQLPDLDFQPRTFSASLRNRAFLIAGNRQATLRFSTTRDIRWTGVDLPFVLHLAQLGPRYQDIFFLEPDGTLHQYLLDDPYPQAGWTGYFRKIHYEGQSEPLWIWQSTGGTEAFERKLSLVPLIFGTLKGTMYAMLFAVPIALLAAIYTSLFLKPSLKRFVKPTMEIMASLPSVVLGFIGALWLAPLIEGRMPSIFLMLVTVPLFALLAGLLWKNLPRRIQILIPDGHEWIAFMPIMILTAWGCWHLGPYFERMLFVVTDPDSGIRMADFRLWWPEFTGSSFQQRNAMVVGFMMGFAVIPIIFTISEDSLSNVPSTLVSGSLALGASRWQTAMRVVVPTASAGVFSALMIGLGRAVGETMIVVMATGNTPIMEMNMFSGMRTLSANIAVELPEAPVGGTLYRTLFLGAFVLFLMTFIVNTVAEVLRLHLREKYKTVG